MYTTKTVNERQRRKHSRRVPLVDHGYNACSSASFHRTTRRVSCGNRRTRESRARETYLDFFPSTRQATSFTTSVLWALALGRLWPLRGCDEMMVDMTRRRRGAVCVAGRQVLGVSMTSGRANVGVRHVRVSGRHCGERMDVLVDVVCHYIAGAQGRILQNSHVSQRSLLKRQR